VNVRKRVSGVSIGKYSLDNDVVDVKGDEGDAGATSDELGVAVAESSCVFNDRAVEYVMISCGSSVRLFFFTSCLVPVAVVNRCTYQRANERVIPLVGML
jgi:hypothetical protein